MSPTAAMNVAATVTLTPGTVISRWISGQDSASAAIRRDTSTVPSSSMPSAERALRAVSAPAQRTQRAVNRPRDRAVEDDRHLASDSHIRPSMKHIERRPSADAP